MNTIDRLLEKTGLKYEDLTNDERDTLQTQLTSLEQNKLTLDTVRTHITFMKGAVEKELCKVGHNNKQDLLLKARLRNYMMLEDFMTSPEKAKQAIERSLSGLGKKIDIR